MAKKAPVILEVENLVKKFKNVNAVNNVSFKVGEGEIVGLLGPNGAGKTSIIQMLLSVLTPSSGSISYFGKDLSKNREEILQQVNFCSSYIRLPWSLTVYENLQVMARFYSVKNRKERVDKIIEIFEIEEFKKKKFTALSAGQMMKVVLAKSFINFPKILLLDEPTASLDPDVAAKIREILLKEREQFNVTMLITSHNMMEVEQLCDKVIFLNKGKILAVDTPEELAGRMEMASVELWIEKGIEKALKIFGEMGLESSKDGKYTSVQVKEVDVAKLLVSLGQADVSYKEITIDRPSLEDFFLKVAREEKNAA